jgi:hypothetical protein
MRKFITALLLVFAVTIIAASQLKPPSPAPTKTSKKPQHSSKDKNREANPPDSGSTSPLPVVNKPVCQQAVVPCAESTDRKNAKPPTDWWLTIFTGALVVVAILQFFAMRRQASFMRRGLPIAIKSARAARQNARATFKAANAAKDSADAVMNSERAWVIVDLEWPSGRDQGLIGNTCFVRRAKLEYPCCH